MKTYLIAFTCIVFFGCADQKKVDRSSFEEELKNREIRRVSEFDILEMARVVGTEIATTSQKTLGMQLKNAVLNGGVEHAISFCNINVGDLIATLENERQVQIRRTSKNYRNPENKPDSIELALLEAYQYNLENDLEVTDNVQKIGQDQLLFTRPILVSSNLCLQCHGKELEQIDANTLQVISELYTEDKATNYEIGDLRGMWSIRMSRKNIVNRIQ